MKKISLRARIIIAMVTTVTVTSTVLAGGAFLIKQKLEAVTFGSMVRDQLEVVIAQAENGVRFDNKLFQSWDFYSGTEVESLPQRVRSLTPGSHHSVRVEDRFYQVEVAEWNGAPAILTYDITEWEIQEHESLAILLYGIGIVMFAAILMGFWASRAILSPVQALSARLTSIRPDERNTRISPDFSNNEMAPIANAVDRYLERLDSFVERERSFSSAASHELRTPLSVVMGAVDVLDANQQTPASRRALARIKRACGEMLAFIEATLFLSRENITMTSEEAGADIRDIVTALLEDSASYLKERHIEVSTDFEAALVLRQPASIAKIVVGNILRNAIQHTKDESLTIRTQGHSLTIADTGEGIPAEQLNQVYDRSFTTKRGGTGLGLNLVKRICDRFKWTISIDSRLGRGTTVSLNFDPDADREAEIPDSVGRARIIEPV